MKNYNFIRYLFIVFNACFISLKFDAPVERIIGFFVLAIVSTNFKSVFSKDEILYNFIFCFSKTQQL